MRKLLKAVFTAVAAVSLLATAGMAQQVMTHHVRDEIRTGAAAPVGRLPQNQTLQLDLVLPLRDATGLKTFLTDIYNPKSANYRHFVTPAEFTAKFGPTQAQYDEVVSFAKTYELEVVGGSRDGMDVQVKGTVAAIETALHVSMNTYQHPTENRIYFAADREPTTQLSFSLWHVSGLDNYSIPHPLVVKKSDFAAAHGIYPEAVVSHATTGSGPSASFLGSDMRAAYATGTTLTGAGQNLGLLEYYGTDLADLTTYYKNVGQTNSVPVSLLSTDGTSTSCLASQGCDDTEQTLDITQALGMAPGLSSLVVYVGSTDTAIISAMTTHNPLPTTIGCSWGWTPADPSTLDPYFQKMAAQGQNFFAASGDASTWSSRNEAWPADDAYVVSVGGTDLTTSGAGGPWASETAWVDSGGGISPDGIAIPSWQKLAGVINSSNHGSTALRNGPDVSANANFTFYVCADQTTCTANSYGGTSFAAPMWAGFIALVNQQLANSGKSSIGFINPTIYSQNVTSSYGTDFHDITSGTSGSYSAVTGYDLVTGWGSPKPALITALTGGTQTAGFTLSASPASVTVLQGSAGSSTITSTVSGGFSSAVSLTASGQPAGVTVGFSPASITGSGSSSMNINVASTTAAGTYTLTVTGTSGSTVQTTTVTLTVTSTTAGFSISASPTSITVARSSSGRVTVSTTVSGGFNSAISLSASGQASGTSFSFNPSSITGAGSSTLTITASRRATRGTRTITITGTSGGTSHSTTISLTIQ
ncbi:MAG TPA: S53 family peptidase [Terracidiphilus sp.]|jgi:kumamolisin